MSISNKTKRSLLISLLIIIAFFLVVKNSYSKDGSPGVSTTRHDLTPGGGSTTWQYETTEVCVFCHTPHAQTNQYPLWNHTTPAVANYSMYTSTTFNMGPVSAIGATSLLCMSCHDGTVAMNVLLNAPGRGNANYGEGAGVIPKAPAVDYTKLGEVYYPQGFAGYPGPNISGSYIGSENVDDLRDEHPISFTYLPSIDANDNNFPTWNAGGYITGGITSTKYPLYGSDMRQFECSTCHDVHDTVNYTKMLNPGDPGEVFFLRVSNANSQMCRDCHQNK